MVHDRYVALEGTPDVKGRMRQIAAQVGLLGNGELVRRRWFIKVGHS